MAVQPPSPVTAVSPVSSLPQPSLTDTFKDQVRAIGKHFDLIAHDRPSQTKDWEQSIVTAMHTAAKIYRQDPEQLKQVTPEMATLYMQLGHFYYGGSMLATRTAFLGAYYLLAGLDFHPALQQIYENSFQGETLEDISKRLKGVEIPFDNLYPPKDMKDQFLFASCLRWMGHAVQNISYTDRFRQLAALTKIYDPSLSLLEAGSRQTENLDLQRESNWQCCQLKYNSDRCLLNLAKPDDFEGEFRLLERLKPYLAKEGDTPRASVLQGQILNIQSIIQSKIVQKMPEAERPEGYKKCYQLVDQGLQIAERTPTFNPFLKANFYNNRARYAMSAQIDNPGQIESDIKKATLYATEQNFNNYYHAIYFITAARFALQKGAFEEAEGHLKVADMVNLKYAESSGELQATVKGLRDLMAKTKPAS